MKHPAPTPAAPGAKRQEFLDGSALVTYADGGRFQLSAFAFADPPPPPPGAAAP